MLTDQMRRLACGLLLAVLVAICGDLAHTADLTGRASIIDGDTIEIHGQRMRLHGIDAPEAGQTCTAGSREYRCGQEAALALADFIGQQTVACEQRDTDRYGRIVAVSRVGEVDASATWKRIGVAIERLQALAPTRGEEVH